MEQDGVFTAEDFRARAIRHGLADEEWEGGEHRFNPHLKAELEAVKLRDAAVLVPVIDRGEAASVLLTRRTDTLRKHSGQIAFPGGAIDAADGGAENAALRETFEEVGLDAEHVEVVGKLPRYSTLTGFRITPVLGVVAPGFTLKPNPVEVDDIFEVPLAHLMTPERHVTDSRVWNGRTHFYYTIAYEKRRIWGITAGIIRALYERLYA